MNVGFDLSKDLFMSLHGNVEGVEQAFGCVKIEHDSLGDIDGFLVLTHWLRIHSKIND